MTVRRTLVTATVGLVVVIGAVAALGLGALALERRAATRLDATMAVPVARLVPDGQVGDVDVTDSPALLAARRGSVQQVVAHASTDGHDVLLVVRRYGRDAQRAQSVSWEVSGITFAPGWANVRSDHGAYTDRARTTVDGHVYEVVASARTAGSEGTDGAGGAQAPTMLVEAGALTVDGSPLAVADAPPAVRAALAPVTLAVPDPRAGARARRVWFDERGAGVELYARDVSAARA